MTPFTYARAGDVAEAVRLGADAATAYLGGGTNLIDLMRETVAHAGDWSMSRACRATSWKPTAADC